jgi:phenylacetate-CoA ligase
VDSLRVQRLYESLPIFLQSVACSYFGWKQAQIRFNKLFHRLLAFLMESEKWSVAEIEAYQSEQLRSLIGHAYEAVPYYRDLMKDSGLTPEAIRKRSDLAKLPVLTKEHVRHNLERLVSERVEKRSLIRRHTSGTTGKSLHFYSEKSGMAFQWAVWWRHRKRFGIDFGTWHINFTGKVVAPIGQRRPPFWRWNPPMHQVLVGMQHLTPVKVPALIKFLNGRRFELFTGYPSIVHAFVLAARECGLDLGARPKLVSTGAENMLDYQRRDILEYTGAILTDTYGLSEGCGNASHCPQFVYHEDPEFGIVECVDPVPLGDGRTRGRIVCTGFASPAFPFIRYDTGDIGIWADPAAACPCGRKSPVLLSIEGRTDDYVVTPEGNRIMRFDYIFKDAASVRESQVVQKKPGEVVVKIVRRPSYSTRDEESISREIHYWISPRLGVHFQYVDEIERERNGKFKAVKSLMGRGTETAHVN